MATPYDFLLQDFANWNPNIPDAEESNPFVPGDWQLPDFTTAPPADTADEPTDPTTIDYWGGEPGVAAQSWGAVMLPLAQLLSNNEQFQTEFFEAQRRFDEQFGWSQMRDQFNMDLATRQQSAQEQQAAWAQGNFEDQLDDQRLNDATSRQVALGNLDLAQLQTAAEIGQWEQSFAAQQVNDAHARSLADQRLAFEESQSDQTLSLREREQIWQEEYGRKSLELQQEAARYQTFGRAQSPARWVSNWG